MNRDEISRIAHADHPIAAPLDDDSVRRLLEHGIHPGAERALDLGCGGAEWLLRALVTHPHLRAEGVDTSKVALTHAHSAAVTLGVQDRLTLHHGDATDFTSPHTFDLILVVGATHAFGGLIPTLAAANAHLAPNGRVIIGEGFWQHDPSPDTLELFGETLTDLATTVDRTIAEGWTPVHGHISSRQELDDYEWAWTGSLTSWALDHPTDPASPQALTTATTHRSEWLHLYRDTFGFLTLVLRRT